MVNQRGIGLIEVLIGLGLLGVLASAFLPTVSSGILRGGRVQESYYAQDLARTQMEDVKSLSYDDTGSYPVAVPPSGDFSVSVTAIDESGDNKLQKIIVRVSHGQRLVLVLESYKAKR